uniref:Tubulin polyglutamylase TTLL4 n=3 Tax=Lygus hesperus TaxID=30085 RepID=A0A0A9Z7J3_LYGHE
MLFDAWETKYHSNREEGVQLLESKCLEQIHLDVSEVEPRQFTYCPSDHSIKGEELGDGDGDTTSIDSGGTRGLLRRKAPWGAHGMRSTLNRRIQKRLLLQKSVRRKAKQ